MEKHQDLLAKNYYKGDVEALTVFVFCLSNVYKRKSLKSKLEKIL